MDGGEGPGDGRETPAVAIEASLCARMPTMVSLGGLSDAFVCVSVCELGIALRFGTA
jgi:hypothetical protein